MLKSMTGYSKSQITYNQKDIIVELRSVNHKGFEYSCRVPRTFAFLEDKIKNYIQKEITRGKVDVYVSVDLSSVDSVSINLNIPMLNGYLDMLYKIRDEYGLKDDISVMTVARNNDIFDTKRIEQDQDEIWEGVKECLDISLKSFIDMRIKEGQNLKNDLLERKIKVLSALKEIEDRVPQIEKEYKVRLETKIKELLGDNTKIDENRILTEVAIFAEKINVTEEIVRLKSHMDQFEQMLNSEEAIGRKMNFLAQEMNREANTIVSKTGDISIVKIIVDIKSEIEIIREQIQNIE